MLHNTKSPIYLSSSCTLTPFTFQFYHSAPVLLAISRSRAIDDECIRVMQSINQLDGHKSAMSYQR